LISLPFYVSSQSRTDKSKLISQLKYADSIKNSDSSKATKIAQLILRESKEKKLDSIWIRTAIMLGNIYTENGSREKSIAILTEAIDLGERKNMELLSSHAVTFLAQDYMKNGSFNKALTYYQNAQKIFIKHQDHHGIMRNQTAIGIVFMNLSNYDSAANQFHEALKIARSINHVKAEGLINNNLGRLYQRKREYHRAIPYLETSVELLTKSGKLNSVMRSKLLLAEIFLAQKKFTKALNYATNALDGSIQYQDYQNIIRSEKTIGEIYNARNEKENAVVYYLRAIGSGSRAGLKSSQVMAMTAYIRFLLQENKIDETEELLKEAIRLAKEINTTQDLIELYKLQEIKYELTGQVSLAYALSKKHQLLSDSLRKQESDELAKRLENEYQKQKIENKLTKSQLQNVLNRQAITWLAIGIILAIGIAIVIIVRQKNKDLKHERNEAILKRKNIEIQKNKEIESAKSEIKGQEDERKRLAKELHDGLGGSLATIKLNLSLIESKIAESDLLEPVISSLDDACQEVRTISHHLLPKVFEKNSFTQAAKNYLTSISRGTNIEVNLEIFPEEDIERIDAATKNDLYRIIQELTNNILKHAKASFIDVQLIKHEDYLSLIVEDDGIGFEKEEKPTGIGLNNIQSRIVLLNGTLHIDSKKNRGTLIDIQIPNENQ